MKKLLLSITIIIFSTFLFSCSKDDTASDSIDENGGQIYRYQVVTINVGSTSLTNNVYLIGAYLLIIHRFMFFSYSTIFIYLGTIKTVS